MELSRSIESIGLLAATPVKTGQGQDYVQDGQLYFYLTNRLPGEQIKACEFGQGDGRFVGEIIGQHHLALSRVEDCVREGDLLATVRDWALPQAKKAMDLQEGFCKDYLDTFAALYPVLPRQIIHRDPNQFVCVAWFGEQDKNRELFETNKQMTRWLLEKIEELKDI